jgi:hypothetical protein
LNKDEKINLNDNKQDNQNKNNVKRAQTFKQGVCTNVMKKERVAKR